MSAPFSILTVCTGNICRSPAAERLLAHHLEADPAVTVTSAGVGAVVGAPIPPPMARRLSAAGVSPEGFAARQVTESILRSADLVLTLTRDHRAHVVDLAPAVVRRTYTLREFAGLASHIGRAGVTGDTIAQRLAALAATAGGHRSALAAEVGYHDVIDPWRRDESIYDQAFSEVSAAVSQIIEVVRSDR